MIELKKTTPDGMFTVTITTSPVMDGTQLFIPKLLESLGALTSILDDAIHANQMIADQLREMMKTSLP